MSKGTAIVVLMVVLGGGFLLGKAVTRDKDGSGGNTATASVAKPSAADSKNAAGIGDGVDRARVPLDGANKGSAGREGEHRRVLRLPVPVLQPRAADHGEDREGVRQAGPRVLPPQPAALPPGRAAGVRGRDRGRRAGEVLADARQAVRQPAEPEAPRPGEVRPGDRPRRGQVQGGAGQGDRQGPHRRRHGGRQADRRPGDAELVHQRPQRPGRAAVRGVQEGDRRGDRLRQQADRQGHARRARSTRR